MRIEAITRRKVIVELNETDLSDLAISYDDLDYASVETRRAIWEILDRVRENTGCDIDPSGQLLIDAMPRPGGGCILFFTLKAEPGALPFAPAEPEGSLRKQQLLSTFEFANVNVLLDCAAAYAQHLRHGGGRLFTISELYVLQNRYRLLVCPVRDLVPVRQFFAEFARLCGEEVFSCGLTREHWQRVGNSQSFCFERLGGYGDAPPCDLPNASFSPGSVYP